MSTGNRIIEDITSFIFIGDEPRKADVIFVPGTSWPQLAERAAGLYRQGLAPLIVPSGKYSYKCERFESPRCRADVYNGNYRTEWEFLRDVLMKNGVPEEVIIREDRSLHTVENAQFTRLAVDALGLTIKTAIICCKSYHARRCLLTFGWVFPEVKFVICPTDMEGIGRGNWYRTAYGREHVLGEVSKCGSYFKEAAEMWSNLI